MNAQYLLLVFPNLQSLSPTSVMPVPLGSDPVEALRRARSYRSDPAASKISQIILHRIPDGGDQSFAHFLCGDPSPKVRTAVYIAFNGRQGPWSEKFYDGFSEQGDEGAAPSPAEMPGSIQGYGSFTEKPPVGSHLKP
ncbi:MAG: hypothetical protein HZA81_02495 [Candidatus Taylorbacteria bacterium]|nr:hypothetical protein [Candidatus Taylorbacteria bacterium]